MSKASWRCPERGDGTLYGSVLTMLMSQSLDRTQKDIAEALGVSEKHLSQIVTGKMRLSWALADRWAHVNGCRIIAQPVFPDTSHAGRGGEGR